MKFCLKFTAVAAVLACGFLVGCGGGQLADGTDNTKRSPQNAAAMGDDSSESATDGALSPAPIGPSNPDGRSNDAQVGSQPGSRAGAATNTSGSAESSHGGVGTALPDSGESQSIGGPSQPGNTATNGLSAKGPAPNNGLTKAYAQNAPSPTANTTEGSDTRKVSMPQFNELSERESYVILKKGTERAFTGEYWATKDPGTYICRRCNAPLYKSDDKFDSECGWPSFDDEVKGAVRREVDADGRRTEIICANCGGHLGHVFLGERFTEKNTRHCVNSLSIKLIPKGTELPPVIKVPESK